MSNNFLKTSNENSVLFFINSKSVLRLYTFIRLEISRIRCAYYTTQFNFKLYISNLFDSSSAVKAYKMLKMNQIDSKYTV